jgi:Rhodanese-like domain
MEKIMKLRIIVFSLLVAAAMVVPATAQKTKKNKSGKVPAAEKSSAKKADKPVVAPVADDRISIEELKAKLDAGAQILILDVRATDGWNSSTNKIKGAVRVPMEDVDKKKGEWNKATEIITYCS